MNQEYFRHLWVAPTTAQQLLGAAALLIVLGALVALYLYDRHQRAVQRQWGRIAALGISRGLSTLDLDLLRQFYRQVSPARRPLLANPETFQSMLRHYLASQVYLQPEGSVELLAGMFPAMKFKLGIETLRDIVPGEVMALKLPAENILVQTKEIKPDAVTLALAAAKSQSRQERPGNPTQPEPCQLYCFRPGFGGFSLKGMLERSGTSLVFSHLETITRHRKDHLMASLVCSVRLSAKRPVFDKHPSPTRKPPPGNHSEEGVRYVEMHVSAVTELVSDRALLCTTPSAADLPGKLEESVKEWALELTLPSGETLAGLGRIMHSRLRERFLVRLYGLSEEHKGILSAAISAADPQPERFL